MHSGYDYINFDEQQMDKYDGYMEYDVKAIQKSYNKILEYYGVQIAMDIQSSTNKIISPIIKTIPPEFTLVDCCVHNAMLHGFDWNDIETNEMEEFIIDEYEYLNLFHK